MNHLSKTEITELKIAELEKRSRKLKSNHVWGNWDNWRKFVEIDIQVNKLKILLLELENELLEDSLEVYKSE